MIITLVAKDAVLAITALRPAVVVAAEDSSKLESEMSKFYVVFFFPKLSPSLDLLSLVKYAELFLLRSEFTFRFYFNCSVNFLRCKASSKSVVSLTLLLGYTGRLYPYQDGIFSIIRSVCLLVSLAL